MVTVVVAVRIEPPTVLHVSTKWVVSEIPGERAKPLVAVPDECCAEKSGSCGLDTRHALMEPVVVTHPKLTDCPRDARSGIATSTTTGFATCTEHDALVVAVTFPHSTPYVIVPVVVATREVVAPVNCPAVPKPDPVL